MNNEDNNTNVTSSGLRLLKKDEDKEKHDPVTPLCRFCGKQMQYQDNLGWVCGCQGEKDFLALWADWENLEKFFKSKRTEIATKIYKLKVGSDYYRTLLKHDMLAEKAKEFRTSASQGSKDYSFAFQLNSQAIELQKHLDSYIIGPDFDYVVKAVGGLDKDKPEADEGSKGNEDNQ